MEENANDFVTFCHVVVGEVFPTCAVKMHSLRRQEKLAELTASRGG
jgi:hypothetical protein